MKVWAILIWLLALGLAYEMGARTPVSGSEGLTSLAAFEHALVLRDPIDRSLEIVRFLRTRPASEIREVLAAVEAAGHWFDWRDHRLLMAAWVPLDPTAAVDWAFSRPGTLEPRATAAVMDALGFHDPAFAQSVLRTVEPIERRESLHLQMVEGWARSEHRDALTGYLAGQPGSVARQRATTALVTEILKGGTDVAIAWAEAVPALAENRFKQTAFQKAAVAIAGMDPARAARWVDRHRGGEYAARATHGVASRWAEQDPAGAMDWLVSLPSDAERSALVDTTFKRWLREDARAAEGWAGSAAPAAGADPAVLALVRRHLARHPERAMAWAQRAHALDVRTRALASAGRAWLRADREAFMAWLPQSGLEGRVRALILDAPERTLPARKSRP